MEGNDPAEEKRKKSSFLRCMIRSGFRYRRSPTDNQTLSTVKESNNESSYSNKNTERKHSPRRRNKRNIHLSGPAADHATTISSRSSPIFFPWNMKYREMKDLKKVLTTVNNESSTENRYNSLHIACRECLSYGIIGWMLSEPNIRPLALEPDASGRLPLHHMVISICERKISLMNGLEIIDLFFSMHPCTIFHGDDELHTPADLIMEKYIDLMPCIDFDEKNKGEVEMSDQERVVYDLRSHLRKLALQQYRQDKMRFEEMNRYRRQPPVVIFPDFYGENSILLPLGENASIVPLSDNALFPAGQTVCSAESLTF